MTDGKMINDGARRALCVDDDHDIGKFLVNGLEVHFSGT
jgi:hypothetical protein